MLNILDSLYTPIGEDNQDLFASQKLYLYVILQQKICTDTGQAIICKHNGKCDGSATYQDLKLHHVNSTHAKLQLQKHIQFEFITTGKLNTNWCGIKDTC